MNTYRKHLLAQGSTIKEALTRLDSLGIDAVLFIIDKDGKLVGSLSNGDVRRGLLNNATINDYVDTIMHIKPKYLCKGDRDIEKVIQYRESGYRIVPIIDKANDIVNVINFREIKSYLPVDAVIMAGGRGERLRPLTETTPKPMLFVGDKPILEHKLDQLISYGIDDIWISINYRGEQIQSYFSNGKDKNVVIKYITENEPLGTIGAISRVKDFSHDYILVANSDLLTNVDYEKFFLDFIEQGADFSVLGIPFIVNVPYAVLDTSSRLVRGFKEKPSYTYFSNGGIYLMKRSVIANIPTGEYFNATDLMEKLIVQGNKVISYPFYGYWLDIGRLEDFEKANKDIKVMTFS